MGMVCSGHAKQTKGTGAWGPCVGALGKEEPGDGIDCTRSYVKDLVLPS